jgi:protein-S-isoprenylcysteine O-methyltransferase Ste14
LPLGVIFIILGIKLTSSARKLLKDKKNKGLELKPLNQGIYRVMRFPQYTAQVLIFLGITLILDSFMGLILCPILFTILQLKSFLEEKYILSPKIGEELNEYKNKTPNRIFPNPYNYLLIIICILIVYIGILGLLP